MSYITLDGPTIAAGESLSEGLDCTSGDLLRLMMPPEWNDAVVTFQISDDGVTYRDVYQLNGYEVCLPEVVPNSVVIVPLDVGKCIPWIKFRSGGSASPEPQEEARSFKVALDTYQGKPVQTTESVL